MHAIGAHAFGGLRGWVSSWMLLLEVGRGAASERREVQSEGRSEFRSETALGPEFWAKVGATHLPCFTTKPAMRVRRFLFAVPISQVAHAGALSGAR